jgi:phospholipid/cholesterol/gamma-HCH transport system permease protein
VDPAAQRHVERKGSTLALSGDLRIEDAPAVWKELRAAARDARDAGGGALAFDLSRVGAIDGGVIALLVELERELERKGARVAIEGLDERLEPLVDLYRPRDGAVRAERRKPASMIGQIGDATHAELEETKSILDFVGRMVLAAGRIFRSPRAGHWREVPVLLEKTGSDAVPIVVVINFLVGFVMAYQSMKQLQNYGANIYVADLVGISVARELGPLMTAIVITGRSGAAFAAEIGTMRVAEEIDALRTLGLRPFEWLVVPRVVAVALVAPVLTAIADVVGIAGGALVAVWSLGISVPGYVNEAREAVVPWDVESGLIKSVAFGITIALIGCQQGFSASGGAEGVGKRTTSTVVTSLFALVILDTLFTVVFRLLELQP